MSTLENRGKRQIGRHLPPDAQRSMWLAGDGWPIRRIDWPAPVGTAPRGALLFMGGRADLFEKYIESFEHWRQQGWQVTALDWRGQAGSGRFLPDRETGHVPDFQLWVDDLCAFWQDWPGLSNKPRVIVGHSMGGHLVLRAIAEKRLVPDSAVLVAPMLGLLAGGLPMAAQHAVARAVCALRGPTRPAWKNGERPLDGPAARMHLLTHDRTRYDNEQYWRATHPELVMGPASWGWIERALASCRWLARPGVLEGVAVPVQILSTRGDRLVSHRANVAAAARLAQGELVSYGPEVAHEILREIDPWRDAALAAIDGFLARRLPFAPAPS